MLVLNLQSQNALAVTSESEDQSCQNSQWSIWWAKNVCVTPASSHTLTFLHYTCKYNKMQLCVCRIMDRLCHVCMVCALTGLWTQMYCVLGSRETHRYVFRRVNSKCGYVQFAFYLESGVHLLAQFICEPTLNCGTDNGMNFKNKIVKFSSQDAFK